MILRPCGTGTHHTETYVLAATDTGSGAHLEEDAAMGRRVPGGSGRFEHAHAGHAQHLVLAVVLLVVQGERAQAVRVHRFGCNVAVAVVTPAPLGG